MKTKHWFLVGGWLAYVVFAGPFLLSARDWFLVAGGVAVLGALVYYTVKAFKAEGEKSA